MTRGSSIHNEAMVRHLLRAVTSTGARVRVEAYLGPNVGYADLLAELGSLRVIVEAERTHRRVLADLRKARTIGATHLVIATSTARVAASVLRRLQDEKKSPRDPCIVVRPLALAAQALTDLFSRIPGGECQAEINATNPAPSSRPLERRAP